MKKTNCIKIIAAVLLSAGLARAGYVPFQGQNANTNSPVGALCDTPANWVGGALPYGSSTGLVSVTGSPVWFSAAGGWYNLAILQTGGFINDPSGQVLMRGGLSGSGVTSLYAINDSRTNYAAYTNAIVKQLNLWSQYGNPTEFDLNSGVIIMTNQTAGGLKMSASQVTVNIKNGLLQAGGSVLSDGTINLLAGGSANVQLGTNYTTGGALTTTLGATINFQTGNAGSVTINNFTTNAWTTAATGGKLKVNGAGVGNLNLFTLSNGGATISLLPGLIIIDTNYNNGANIAEYSAWDTNNPYIGIASGGSKESTIGTSAGSTSIGGGQLRRLEWFFALPAGYTAAQITNATLSFMLNSVSSPTENCDIYYKVTDTLGSTNDAYVTGLFSDPGFTNSGLSMGFLQPLGAQSFDVTPLVQAALAAGNLTNVIAFRFQMANDTNLTFGVPNRYVLLGFGASSGSGPSLVLQTVPAAPGASTNALLTSLAITPTGTLNPAFASGTTSYTATNTYVNNPVTVTASSADTNATMTLTFNNTPAGSLTNGVASGNQTLTLNPPTNTVKVRVVSQDLSQTNVYTVNVRLQPSQTQPTLTNSVSGNTLTLNWPADHLGYRLLVQTNNLANGVSGNLNDWGTVPGSTAITTTNLTIQPGVANEYYRLVYP